MIALCGTVVEEDGAAPGRILIEDGKIKSFHRDEIPHGFSGDLISYGEYQGKRGFLIFPGFIDLNFKNPERLAALSGGVTSLIRYGTHINTGDYKDNTSLDADLKDLQNVVFNWQDPEKLIKSPGDPECEIEGVRIAIIKTKIHNIKSRIVISTVASLRLIQKARKDGFQIWSEVHPINLYFDTSMITAENKNSLCADPPLRSPDDRAGLLNEMINGNIDFLASGHAPRMLSERKQGVPELDTFGSLVVWLVSEGVPPEIIFKMACLNPSLWILDSKLLIGRIKAGCQANITVVAFNKPAIDSRQLYTRCGWSPYDSRHLRGSVEMVMFEGEKIVDRQWVADN